MAVRLIVNYDYSEWLVLITQYPLNSIPSQFNILPVFILVSSHHPGYRPRAAQASAGCNLWRSLPSSTWHCNQSRSSLYDFSQEREPWCTGVEGGGSEQVPIVLRGIKCSFLPPNTTRQQTRDSVWLVTRPAQVVHWADCGTGNVCWYQQHGSRTWLGPGWDTAISRTCQVILHLQTRKPETINSW